MRGDRARSGVSILTNGDVCADWKVAKDGTASFNTHGGPFPLAACVDTLQRFGL